jgi:CubicO group peptidase (beta-lactamase class C family)
MRILFPFRQLPYYVIGLALVVGCGDESQDPLPEVPLDTFWEVSSPAEQQMDQAVLDELRSDVRDMANVYSLLIVRNGKIVHEQYHNGANMNSLLHVRSITKRITAALVGIGIDEGYIDGLQMPIADLFPEIAEPGTGGGWNAVNVFHLLNMVSGMDWNEESELDDYEKNQNAPLQYIFARDIVHEPGTYYAYNTPGVDLLSYIIERSYGEHLGVLTEQKLFDPLGIQGYEWEAAGNEVKRGGTGLELTARDQAKIGLLFLQNGSWLGDHLVPSGWITQSFDNPLSLDDVEGDHLPGLSIGHTWWTREIEGVTIHYGDGYGGQILMLIPEHNIVVVMNRLYDVDAAKNNAAFSEYFDQILPAILNSVLD